MSVKITALEAENVKRIKAVALTPAPTGLTLVGGNNNQGKTSVLDALAWALGGEKFRPNAAQRDGAVAPAHLRVTLSNGVVVERKGKNSSLTVTDPTGRRSGQQLLNAFVEPLALDLPRFMEASDKEKADILLRIIGIGNELHLRDMEIKRIYDKRTFTGQLAQQKKHFADELISYPDAPEQPLSASDLIRRQQDILARNGENQRLRQQAQELARQEQQCLDELKRTRERIAELEKLRESWTPSTPSCSTSEKMQKRPLTSFRTNPPLSWKPLSRASRRRTGKSGPTSKKPAPRTKPPSTPATTTSLRIPSSRSAKSVLTC